MEEAIASVAAQTYDDWEIVLVDDGSTDGSTAIAQAQVARFPDRVRCVEHDGHANQGMGASRVLGVDHARGRLIAFLDADDTWLPSKLEEQLAILDAHATASAVYGCPLYWHGWTRHPADIERDHVPGIGFEADRIFSPPELLLLTAPLGDGPVPCPSDILVRRDALFDVGGFEPRFRGAYEDVAFFVKLFLKHPVFASTRTWTRYRVHPESCMAITVREGRYQAVRLSFLNWFEEYLYRMGLSHTDIWARFEEKVIPHRHALSNLSMPAESRSKLLTATPNPVPVDSTTTTISWSTGNGSIGQIWISQDRGQQVLFAEGADGTQQADWISPGAVYEFRLYGDTTRSTLLETVTVARLVDPGVGGESFGSLRRVVPISRTFGFDRGQPIDRYYIERFLTQHTDDIHGRVLEIGDLTYTKRFGGPRVSAVDVLHVTAGNPEATMIGDLSHGEYLPSSTFDCVVVVQTLHLIFDVHAAIRTLHRMLKPGGVLLATFPGISHKSRDQWEGSWYWGFTSLSAQRLFAGVFQLDRMTIETYGNVLSTTAFLYGLASSELSREELDYVDPQYETLIAVRAVKAEMPS